MFGRHLFIVATVSMLNHLNQIAGDDRGDQNVHKVHNIVLYPERHSWCQTTPIKQVVAMQGYESLTIDNHVCVGACYSYSIPRTQPAEPGELIGPYCDSCQPKTSKCYHVTLRKSNATSGGNAEDEQIRKRLQIITDCSCSSCSKTESMTHECDLDDGNTSELPLSLHAVKDSQEKADVPQDVPELMALPSPLPHTSSFVGHHGEGRSREVTSHSYHLDDGIRRLLKLVQQEDLSFLYSGNPTAGELLVDMKHLAEIVQGADLQLSDRDVIDFVNWANENEYNGDDAMELDAIKLKTALEAYHQRELKQRHRKFGLGTLGLVVAPSTVETLTESYVEGSHLGLGHKKGTHIGMGIRDNLIPSGDEDDHGGEIDNDDDDDDDDDEDELDHHGHHKIGDVLSAGGTVAHLVMGPHGSLVLAPSAEDRLSLGLPSEDLSPNQEGAVIDYHHHHDTHHHKHHQPSPSYHHTKPSL